MYHYMCMKAPPEPYLYRNLNTHLTLLGITKPPLSEQKRVGITLDYRKISKFLSKPMKKGTPN